MEWVILIILLILLMVLLANIFEKLNSKGQLVLLIILACLTFVLAGLVLFVCVCKL